MPREPDQVNYQGPKKIRKALEARIDPKTARTYEISKVHGRSRTPCQVQNFMDLDGSEKLASASLSPYSFASHFSCYSSLPLLTLLPPLLISSFSPSVSTTTSSSLVPLPLPLLFLHLSPSRSLLETSGRVRYIDAQGYENMF